MKIIILLYFLNLVLLLFPVNSEDDDTHYDDSDDIDSSHYNDTDYQDDDLQKLKLLAKFPSLVTISEDETYICPGVLISPKHVVASAQCFVTPDDNDPTEVSDDFVVKINCGDIGNGGFQTRKVSKICVHKRFRTRIDVKQDSFQFPATVNDIAILESQRQTTLHSPVSVNRRCSPTDILKQSVSPGTKCNLIGWVNHLHKITFIHDEVNKTCSLECYKYVFILPLMHSCVLIEYNSTKSHIFFPLYCENKLKGTVSYFKTQNNITAMVVTRTSIYYNWTQTFKETGDMNYCLKSSQRKRFNKNYQPFLPFLVLTLFQYFQFKT